MIPGWLVTGILAFVAASVVGIVIAVLSGKRTPKQALLLALAVSVGLVIGNAI